MEEILKRRILVALDTYVPARISGALQMHDFAKELVARGHHPTVLVPTTDPRQAGRVEHVDGVEVLRVRAPLTKDVGLVRRALAECLLPFALWRGLRRSPLAGVRWDGVAWYSPTIFLGALAAVVKRKHRCRGYLIVRDLFPDWAVDSGIMRRGAAWRFFKAVERLQYRVADVIGVQTPGNVALVARDCAAPSKIEVLDNWLAAPVARAVDLDLSTTPLAGCTVFAYAGNMGPAQGMDCLIDLALALRDESGIGFLFMGRGSEVERLRARATAAGLSRVVFLDEVPAEDVAGILAQCHAGLVALDPRHTTHNIPGKFLTYLHAGLPVLARINPGNDLEHIITGEGVGRATTSLDPVALEAAARELAGDAGLRARMGTQARALVQRDYSPAAAVSRVLAGLFPS